MHDRVFSFGTGSELMVAVYRVARITIDRLISCMHALLTSLVAYVDSHL